MFFFKTFLAFWIGKEYRRYLSPLLILLLIQIIIIFFYYDALPPQIPLFLSKLWGESRLADSNQIITIPVICAVVTVLNTLLAALFASTEKVLSRLLLHVSIVLNTLGMIIIIQIIRLTS